MTYVYKCWGCGNRIERDEPMAQRAVTRYCGKCRATMRRVISGGAGFRLLGTDWTSKGRA